MKANLATTKLESEALSLAQERCRQTGIKIYYYVSQLVYKDVYGSQGKPKKIQNFVPLSEFNKK